MNSPYDTASPPSERMLRQFSALWILFFGAIASRQALSQEYGLSVLFGVVSIGVGAMGLIRPGLMRPIFVGWMKLAHPVGWLVSRIVLTAIFVGVFTPVALVFRVMGRDALGLKPSSQARTYWRAKPPAASKMDYLRQF